MENKDIIEFKNYFLEHFNNKNLSDFEVLNKLIEYTKEYKWSSIEYFGAGIVLRECLKAVGGKTEVIDMFIDYIKDPKNYRFG